MKAIAQTLRSKLTRYSGIGTCVIHIFDLRLPGASGGIGLGDSVPVPVILGLVAWKSQSGVLQQGFVEFVTR